MKLPGDLAKGLADLSDAEVQLAPHGVGEVVEFDEDARRRLRPKIGQGRVFFHGAHEGLEHEVELARGGQRSLAALRAQRPPLATVRARLAGGNGELVPLVAAQ
jgi:hypothetical protein